MMNVVNTKSDTEATVKRTPVSATFSVAMPGSIEEQEQRMWQEFGAKVRARREQMRWTQEQCAEWAGMKRQQWNRIEGGASTKRKTLLRVADVLRLQPDLVLRWAGQILPGDTSHVIFGHVNTAETTRLLSIFGDLPADTKEDAFAILETLWRRHASRGDLPIEDTEPLPARQVGMSLHEAPTRKMLGPSPTPAEQQPPDELHPTDAEIERTPASQPQLPISRPAAVMSDPKGEDGDPDKKPPSAIRKDLQDAQRDRRQRKTGE